VSVRQRNWQKSPSKKVSSRNEARVCASRISYRFPSMLVQNGIMGEILTMAPPLYGPPSFTEEWGPSTGDIVDRMRILLADDHSEFLEDVQPLLGEAYEIVGAVNDGIALVEAAIALKPDLIISDISMPGLTGFQAALKIRALGLTPKLIFLTMQSSPAYVKKAQGIGAMGYVLKAHATEQLPLALSRVSIGETFVSPEIKTRA
jgi:CheY-like chemotaxis protein